MVATWLLSMEEGVVRRCGGGMSLGLPLLSLLLLLSDGEVTYCRSPALESAARRSDFIVVGNFMLSSLGANSFESRPR